MVKPHGAGPFINGLHVVGNVFKTLNGSIDRIEHIDTTYAGMNFGRMVNIEFRANTFNGISETVSNPAVIKHTEASEDNKWVIDTTGQLPFLGRLGMSRQSYRMIRSPT